MRKQILQGRHVVTIPKSADTVRSFWAGFSRAYADAYGQAPANVEFKQGDDELACYAPATAGSCLLYSGGVESTYLGLLYPSMPRFTIETDADVHPRGGEMFIHARARGFGEVLYGGNEREWGERAGGVMWDRHTGRWVESEGFEFTETFRTLWWEYLGVRILCPTEHVYKDEIVKMIFDTSPDAYYALQSCWTVKLGWCGYCDKCLMTGAIIEALRLPPLFQMKASEYSEAIARELETYRTGDYDPFWRLPVFRRLQDVFGYSLTV